MRSIRPGARKVSDTAALSLYARAIKACRRNAVHVAVFIITKVHAQLYADVRKTREQTVKFSEQKIAPSIDCLV